MQHEFGELEPCTFHGIADVPRAGVVRGREDESYATFVEQNGHALHSIDSTQLLLDAEGTEGAGHTRHREFGLEKLRSHSRRSQQTQSESRQAHG